MVTLSSLISPYWNDGTLLVFVSQLVIAAWGFYLTLCRPSALSFRKLLFLRPCCSPRLMLRIPGGTPGGAARGCCPPVGTRVVRLPRWLPLGDLEELRLPTESGRSRWRTLFASLRTCPSGGDSGGDLKGRNKMSYIHKSSLVNKRIIPKRTRLFLQ